MVQTNFKPADLTEFDALFWALYNRIQLQSGVFSLDRRRYQEEIMQTNVRRMCFMKATQGGFTEAEVIRILWGLIHKKYKRGALYLFPTTDDVLEFGKSRFNPLIIKNPKSIGRFVKPGGKGGTDTASLKKIHDAFLYLRGARLTQSSDMGDAGRGSTKLSSIPVDICVFDEVDFMDDQVIQKALGRMGDSDVKEEVYIGNPRIPGSGIDAIFQESDQRYLFRKCSCGHSMSADDSFPECVHIRDDGTGFIACGNCDKPVGLENVEWVSKRLDKNITMRGYHWSQLSSMTNDPAEILNDYNDPPQGNLSDVYRLRLGLPHVALEDMLIPSVVRECCTDDKMAASHKGPCAMGVDVGKIKHIVIGTRTGKEQFEIIKAVRVTGWNEIHDLAKQFNVKSAVVDSRPYEDEARSFQKQEPYKIFLCEYNENSIVGTNYNPDTGIVKQNRTEICDTTHRLISEKKIRIPRRSEELDIFVTQLCNMAKLLEKNKRTGMEIFRYNSVGKVKNDHYRHALNYFYLAAKPSRLASVTSSRPRAEYAVCKRRTA